MDDGVDQATLTFREQSDGRKVARLPTGKIALVDYDSLEKIKDGETWLVQLEHHQLYAVARPLERMKKAAEPGMASPTPMRNPSVIVTGKTTPAKPAPVAPVVHEAPANRPMPNMFLRPLDRVAIFVDGANTDYAAREAGYHLDYHKVGAFLKGKGVFYAAYFYIADFSARDPLQVKFLDFLAHRGYIVRKKAVKVIRDRETGQDVYKANVDTELVLDMVNTADNFDVAFLLSGDSDYERCVDLLRSRGKRVYVMTSENVLSRELSHVADKPIFFIEDYRDLLERDGS